MHGWCPCVFRCSIDCCVSLLWSRRDAKLIWNTLLVYFCMVPSSPSSSHAKEFHVYWRNAVDFVCAVRRIVSLKSAKCWKEVVSCWQCWSVGPIFGLFSLFHNRKPSHQRDEDKEDNRTCLTVFLVFVSSALWLSLIKRESWLLLPLLLEPDIYITLQLAAIIGSWDKCIFSCFVLYKKRKTCLLVGLLQAISYGRALIVGGVWFVLSDMLCLVTMAAVDRHDWNITTGWRACDKRTQRRVIHCSV